MFAFLFGCLHHVKVRLRPSSTKVRAASSGILYALIPCTWKLIIQVMLEPHWDLIIFVLMYGDGLTNGPDIMRRIRVPGKTKGLMICIMTTPAEPGETLNTGFQQPPIFGISTQSTESRMANCWLDLSFDWLKDRVDNQRLDVTECIMVTW